MNIVTHQIGENKIAELQSDETIISNSEEGIDLMGDLYYQGFDSIILHEHNINTDFFELKNGMVGEILQKFSTYRVRLAIVGDFSKYSSNSLKDFIYESNKGRQVYFVADLNEALKALSNKP